MSKSDDPREIPFERAIKRLEEIAAKLEDGDIALEKSLKLFEEGVALASGLDKRLSNAEMKVEQLLTHGEHPRVVPLEGLTPPDEGGS